MISRLWAPGIKIMGVRMKSGGTPFEELTGEALDDFLDDTEMDLEDIQKMSTGRELLRQISESGHTVRIVRVWTQAIDGNSCGSDKGKQHLARFVPLSTSYGLEKGEAITELTRVVRRAGEEVSVGKPRFLKPQAIATLVGVTLRELEFMMEDLTPIPKDVDDKLRVYLYQCLTPGPGIDAFVYFNHDRDELSDEHIKYLPGENWVQRPTAIGLAHELIHAWRKMTGRVLFEYGYEEEAMTVGLPPFSNMEFTENKLRSEYNNVESKRAPELAIRPNYEGLDPASNLASSENLKRISRAPW